MKSCESEDIKPCPFCGGEEPVAMYDDEDIWCVICQYCDAEGPPGWDDDKSTPDNLVSTEEFAIKKWNNRIGKSLK